MPPERLDGGAIKGSLPTVHNDRLCAGSESTLETEEDEGNGDAEQCSALRVPTIYIIRTRVRAFLSGLFFG